MSDDHLSHRCFGCHKAIADHEPHIHVPLDDWAAKNGKEPIGLAEMGLDEMLTFAFCPNCYDTTEKDGWAPEQHEIDDTAIHEWLSDTA